MRLPDRYTVIGDPIDHSLSPVMQSAAFTSAGLPAVYDRTRVAPGGLESFLTSARGTLCGFNVTIPHKEEVARRADGRDEAVACIGAANTVLVRDGRLEARNTDVDGFEAALDQAEVDLRGSRVVVLGAGGAARAVTYSVLRRGGAVTLLARNRARAEAIRQTFGPGVSLEVTSWPVLRSPFPDLLVNATPLGMASAPHKAALPLHAPFPSHLVVFDLIYGRETPLLAHARRSACRVIDGFPMLLHQGAAAFRLWTGREPDLTAMRQALEGVQ